MPTYANITIANNADGVLYANAVVLTSTEADLFNGGTIPNQDPIPILYGQAIVAVVTLTVSGKPVGNSTYVVMQTDMGDGTWIDVAWCMYTNNLVAQTFVLCGGGTGSINNAFQQTRNANSTPTPQANGSNAMPLGGRIRFVGRTSLTGGSSYIASNGFAGVTCTIRYKLLGLN